MTLPRTTRCQRASPPGQYIAAAAASSRKTSTQTVPESVITPGSLHPCEVRGWKALLNLLNSVTQATAHAAFTEGRFRIFNYNRNSTETSFI